MSAPQPGSADPWRTRVAAALSNLPSGGGAPDYDRALREELAELEAAAGLPADDVSRAQPLALLQRRAFVEVETSRRSLVELPAPWGHLALLASADARRLCIDLASRALGQGLAAQPDRAPELHPRIGAAAWPAVEQRRLAAQGAPPSPTCAEAVQAFVDSSAARRGESALSRLGRVLLARLWHELPVGVRQRARAVALSNLFDLLEAERGLSAPDLRARLEGWLPELLAPRENSAAEGSNR
jgi:hypothetical protein